MNGIWVSFVIQQPQETIEIEITILCKHLEHLVVRLHENALLGGGALGSRTIWPLAESERDIGFHERSQRDLLLVIDIHAKEDGWFDKLGSGEPEESCEDEFGANAPEMEIEEREWRLLTELLIDLVGLTDLHFRKELENDQGFG